MAVQKKRSELLTFKYGQTFRERYKIVALDPPASSDTTVKPLGEGGAGMVFLAEQDIHGNTVRRAIKFFIYEDKIAELTQHKYSGQISAKSFGDEIVNLTSFNHENILKIIEAGLEEIGDPPLEVPFLVTDYVEGLEIGIKKLTTSASKS